jgi:hypothetical protein
MINGEKMKQKGKCITGDPIIVDSYTCDWMSVRIHPGSYYRRQEEIAAGLEKAKGCYAEIDMGQYVVIRFSNKDDMTEFHRLHHSYV